MRRHGISVNSDIEHEAQSDDADEATKDEAKEDADSDVDGSESEGAGDTEEDPRRHFDAEDWYFEYQRLYDLENNVDASQFEPDNYIYKVARDRTIVSTECCEEYEDMKWNVFVCNQLKVDVERVSSLKSALLDLAANNDDWRAGEPILNIIDPDLFVFKLFHKQPYSKRFCAEVFGDDCDFDKLDSGCDDEGKWMWQLFVENDTKGYFTRANYQWLATEFVENKQDGTVSITSPIHNLSPRTAYAEVYSGIEHVFQQMMPLFNKIEAIKNRDSDALQVIVKAQRYCIDDGTGYKGHWHKEGLTENIVAGGVYYLEKDELLEGGALKFRNDSCPPYRGMFNYADMNHQAIAEKYDIDWKKCDAWCGGSIGDMWQGLKFSAFYETDQYADVGEGTAVVFDNERLVHRVKMLKNKIGDGQRRHRSFLAFFIVDPSKPTRISTKHYPSLRRKDYAQLLIGYGCAECPLSIAMQICEFAVCGMTRDEAEQLREKDIATRKNKKSKGKFGYFHY